MLGGDGVVGSCWMLGVCWSGVTSRLGVVGTERCLMLFPGAGDPLGWLPEKLRGKVHVVNQQGGAGQTETQKVSTNPILLSFFWPTTNIIFVIFFANYFFHFFLPTTNTIFFLANHKHAWMFLSFVFFILPHTFKKIENCYRLKRAGTYIHFSPFLFRIIFPLC